MKTNFSRLFHYLQDGLRGEAGQTMAEYGLLIAIIALVVIATAILLGANISTVFGSAASAT